MEKDSYNECRRAASCHASEFAKGILNVGRGPRLDSPSRNNITQYRR